MRRRTLDRLIGPPPPSSDRSSDMDRRLYLELGEESKLMELLDACCDAPVSAAAEGASIEILMREGLRHFRADLIARLRRGRALVTGS